MPKLALATRQILVTLLVAIVGGFILIKLAAHWGGFGYAFIVGIPIVLGVVCGAIARTREASLILVVATLAGGLIFSVIGANIAGLLCAAVFLALSALPFLAGIAIAHLMKARLERKEARAHATARVLAILALPLLPLYYEGRLEPSSEIETVRTTRVVELSAAAAWRSLVFYEQVAARPPALARIGLPTPLRVEGQADKEGAITRCVYEHGYLVKRISVHDPGRELAFDVIEQRNIEDRAIRLIDGSFTLTPTGPRTTRVTLTTRYQSLLRARVFWRPFEHSLTRALHQHVLAGMAQTAASGSPGVAVPAP